MKPILFNTEMVQAILEGRKTTTRRTIKCKYSNTHLEMFTNKYGTRLIELQNEVEGETFGKNPNGSTWHKLLGMRETEYDHKPYQVGDILYVRESWNIHDLNAPDCMMIRYKADNYCDLQVRFSMARYEKLHKFYYKKNDWQPSLFMPREAARIFLKVINIRVERLQDITTEQCLKEGAEGARCDCNGMAYACTDCYNTGWIEPPQLHFEYIWDSTVKKADIEVYGWEVNPWVWVIEFERITKTLAYADNGTAQQGDQQVLEYAT